MLKHFREQRTKLRRFNRFQTPEYRWIATTRVDGPELLVRFGDRTLRKRILEGTPNIPVIQDSAALAMAAVSMSCNAQINLDFPVSEGMAANLSSLTRAYRLWSIGSLAPLRVTLNKVVPSPPRSSDQGVICLSGGLDSLHAALCAREDGDVSHALLVAGADYDTAESHGFLELKQRVGRLSEQLGLKLTVVETGIHFPGFNWNQLHSFNLAACLYLFSEEFGFGVYAQDNNYVQDLLRHPWGSNGALPDIYDSDNFGIRTYGRSIDRVGKMRKVLETDPKLLNHLSVCYSDPSTGNNCGICAKCTQTRVLFNAVGASDNGVFLAYPDLVNHISELPIPDNHTMIRGSMCRTAELVDALSDGPLRNVLQKREDKLREALIRLLPLD